MIEFMKGLFSNDFMPHGTCYLWEPGVLWLHVISDSIIALSYYAIPFLLFSFARRRRDLTFQWIFVAFGLFILACGTTHLMSVWTVWHATYRLDGFIKAITAASSLATAVLLVPLLPVLAALPSPTQLARVNRALADEIEDRKKAQDEVLRMNATLEQRIAERTTELRASNEELRESIERYRFLADAMPQIVWTARPDGGVDYFNQRWYEYTGTTSGETQGWGWKTVLHPDDLEASVERWTEALRGGETYQTEYRFRRADGTYRWHLGRGIPRRNQQGDVLQWVGTCTDIDDLKRATEALERANGELRDEMARAQQLEERLLHSQKMEAVGRLAGGVAHDFNNLLTGISGFTDMLMDEVSESPRLMEYAREIQNAAERAGALTNQLLAFSRRQIARPEVIDLNQSVRNVQRMLGRIIGEDIELVTRLEPGLEPVKADPGQVDQVIMNLAVNARDAMPSGGKLVVETANVELGDDAAQRYIGVPPGRYVMLSITDTGTGMDAETRRRLFEPFFTTKETGKGTGLGLSIVYGIVRQNGGDIWVYSEPGRGTTFKIYFPCTAEPAETARPEAAPAQMSAGETVLVVEDESVLRHYACAILRKRGYHVLEAAGPKEAFEIAERQRGAIDLLLTDVVMPDMSGPELAAALRARDDRMRVLFMSGYPHSHITGQGLLEAGVAYLQKPFSSAILLARIRDVLDTGGPRS